MTRAIGIDLGTTYSVAAVIENGRAVVIPNAEGRNLTPSVFAETAQGQRLVGSVAKMQAAANHERTAMSIKRRMGTDYRVSINGRSYSPQEISAFILRKIKTDAERRLGEVVEKAVITVPAYFSDAQRQATREAGLMAGFDVMRIINEPTAAALAYGLDRDAIRTILVWDLGGGTFDVSVLQLAGGFFQVKAVSGDTTLGGDDWDEVVLRHLRDVFQKEYNFDIASDKKILQRVREAGEKAKRELSTTPRAMISLPFIETHPGTVETLEAVIDRDTFDTLTSPLRDRLVGPTRQVLADARVSPEEIDRVVLVGGSTRMPSVRDLVERIFHKKPYIKIDPDEVVALGAAVQAGILMGEIDDVVLVDVTPLSLGIETQGGLFARIIPRNATVPMSADRIFTNAVDGQTEMEIHVLQGEREMAADNISLGRFRLADIPPLPRGKAQVEVVFEIDVNGIVNASAQELYTEQASSIRIGGSHLLSDDRIARAIQEAEGHLADDLRRREEVEVNIRADGMIRAAELGMEEKQRKLSKGSLRRIQAAILDLKEALAAGEGGVIKSLTEGLRKLLERN